MTVYELIRKLARHRPELEVYLHLTNSNGKTQVVSIDRAYTQGTTLDKEDATSPIVVLLKFSLAEEKPKVEPILRFVGNRIPQLNDWVILEGVVRRAANLAIGFTRVRECFECLNEKEIRESELCSPFTSDNE